MSFLKELFYANFYAFPFLMVILYNDLFLFQSLVTTKRKRRWGSGGSLGVNGFLKKKKKMMSRFDGVFGSLGLRVTYIISGMFGPHTSPPQCFLTEDNLLEKPVIETALGYSD